MNIRIKGFWNCCQRISTACYNISYVSNCGVLISISRIISLWDGLVKRHLIIGQSNVKPYKQTDSTQTKERGMEEGSMGELRGEGKERREKRT